MGLASTRPELIQPWAWDEVKETSYDDKQKLGLPQFLAQGHNAHVKAQMLAIFMVAAQKGFWQTDAATIRQMGGELARLVAKNGLPGSGHTAPKHPMWDWLRPRLDAADAQALGARLGAGPRRRGQLPGISAPNPAPAFEPAPDPARPPCAHAPEPLRPTPRRSPPPVHPHQLVTGTQPAADATSASIPRKP